MSNRYKGGVISATPPTTTGGEDGVASGAWTLEQQAQLQAAGLWPAQPTGPWIEDCFSTYLVTGTGSTQTINNGINLSGKGGLVWTKKRSTTGSHSLFDTARGANLRLISNDTAAQDSVNLSFTTTGFSNYTFDNAVTYVSWTFRKQPKFFDVLTYTGTGAVQTIAHNLGSVPGCIIVKQFDAPGNDWGVYHRSLGATYKLNLNSTSAAALSTGYWNNTAPTSTEFTVATSGITNQAGTTYVAYLFAHDAGGFGATGTDNVISCGTFNANNGEVINLGYEPQWLLYRDSSSENNWRLADNMRGFTNLSGTNAQTIQQLTPNSNAADAANSGPVLTSTGFTWNQSGGGNQHIYVAIRRGPMRTPTTGTSVFSVDTYNQTSASDPAFNLGSVTDMGLRRLNNFSSNWTIQNRLTGNGGMATNTTDAESTQNYGFWDNMVGWYQGNSITPPYSQSNWYGWNFKRAPGFMDVVCYTGTLANLTLSHNLGVAPEMMIVKCRSSDAPGGIAANWAVYAAPQGNSKFALLNTTDLFGTSAVLWQATTPTASNFYVGAANYVNGSGQTYVAYLFASVAGVSKVGTYTGTGALLTVDCGFTSGARFVLIKRADTSGDWWTYDSVRGITSGNDPYLFMNSTAVQVDGTNYVDTDTTGFKVTAAAPAGLNASGGTYIFLAIA